MQQPLLQEESRLKELVTKSKDMEEAGWVGGEKVASLDLASTLLQRKKSEVNKIPGDSSCALFIP